MKQIYVLVILGFALIGSGFPIAPAEAQECKVKALRDRDGYTVDQNMKVGFKKIDGKSHILVLPFKNQRTFPQLRLRYGAAVSKTPEVPVATYVAEPAKEVALRFDEKKKVYSASAENIYREILKLKERTAYLEVLQVVNIGGSEMKAPLSDPHRLTCKVAPKGR